jgi:DTW domain-containing protein YfiP
MSIATPAKRAQCASCLRPQSSCICRWIRPIAHEVEVLILQHPREVVRAKGTARLLHLSLPHSRIVVGEQFASAELQALLTGSLHAQARQARARHAVLLYPDTPQDPALGLLSPLVWAPEQAREPSQLRLIVLDGTWRESRKMLYLNPSLQTLPRLPLRDQPSSRYLIRKAQRSHQLSTLEATCAALMQLEGCSEKYQSLLGAFDGFVAQQSAYRKTGLEQASA